MPLRGEGPVLQELAAQGKLPPGRVMSFAKPGEDGPIIFRDVYINDAPPDMRHHMTKRPTQDDVARRTGTQVDVVTFPSSVVDDLLALNSCYMTRNAECQQCHATRVTLAVRRVLVLHVMFQVASQHSALLVLSCAKCAYRLHKIKAVMTRRW